MLAISCQSEITPDSADSNNTVGGNLTATIVQKTTKVSYTETSEHNLQPVWVIGDEIIGFDDAGNTYTLTVVSVSGETATLSGTVPDGVLHLIYKSGAHESDISSRTLTIDYTSQAGDQTMPAVMLADGNVVDGTCHFEFFNAGAILGISSAKGVPQGSKVTKVTISGENLSAATVALSGSSLALTVTEKADDTISVDGLNLTVSDVNGTLSAPVFVAIPANAKISKVSVSVPNEFKEKKPSATPQEGVDYVTIAGIKWANWNLGASSEYDSGWFFPWAGTEGYVRFADTWQPAKAPYFEFSYTPVSANTVSANEYVYVKKFNIIGHSFEWKNAPYHNGAVYSTGWTKYVDSNKDPAFWSGEGSPDNKLTLDLDDDAAHANWGGSWRMPTYEEMEKLINNGYSVFSSIPNVNGSVINGCLVTSVCSEDDGNFLFFPLTGQGRGSDLLYSGQSSMYWVSRLGSNEYNSHYACSFAFSDNYSVYANYAWVFRCHGSIVRPVLD